MEHTDPTPFKTRTKLLQSYRHEVDQIRSGGEVYPVAMEVNLSNVCEQNCHWCISENIRDSKNIRNSHSTLDIHSENVRTFFNDFKRLGGRVVGWSGGGEPTLHPDFSVAVDVVAQAGLQQGLITHGAFNERLTESIATHCQWVRVSIDTHDPALYATKRNTKPEIFQRVLQNVRNLVDRGAFVGLNMNVATWNLPHIDRLHQLACELNVAYLQIRPTLPTPFPHVQSEDLLHREQIPDILNKAKMISQQHDDSTRLIVSFDKFEDLFHGADKADAKRSYSGCRSHRLFVVLDYNGDLVVCMYHLKDERFIFGNVYKNTLEEIWESKTRADVMYFCDENLKHNLHECQVCCKGHEINKVLINGVTVDEESAPKSQFI